MAHLMQHSGITGQLKKDTESYFTSIYLVCCQVWPAPIKKAGNCCPLHTDMTWSNTYRWWALIWWAMLSSVSHGTYQMKKLTRLLSLARFMDRPHQEKPGSPKQCLHSCQAATHTQTLAYIKARQWRSADTNTPKQKPEAYVTPSVRKQAAPLLTVPTWEALWKIKTAKPFWESSEGHWLVCACVCTVRGGRGAGYLIRKHRRSVRPASYNKQQHFDQINVGLPLMFLLCLHACHPAGHAHKHSCQSLNLDLTGLMNTGGK